LGYRCVLGIVLLSGLGCAADGDKGQLDEFWKDLTLRESVPEAQQTDRAGSKPVQPACNQERLGLALSHSVNNRQD